MRTWRLEGARKTHPQTFKIGLNHCPQTSIPVWSLWQIIWQNRMETNVFASVLSFCESGWKLFSQEERAEMTKGDVNRWLYRGQRPNWIARTLNRVWAAFASTGVT